MTRADKCDVSSVRLESSINRSRSFSIGIFACALRDWTEMADESVGSAVNDYWQARLAGSYCD